MENIYSQTMKRNKALLFLGYLVLTSINSVLAQPKLKYGYIDTTGKIVIPAKFDIQPGEFSEGLAVVKIRNSAGVIKYGFMDKTGKVVIQPIFDEVRTFHEGLAPVKKNIDYEAPLWGFIDKTGKIVIPYQYYEVRTFHEGLAAVENRQGYWGFIDKAGKIVSGLQYKQVGDFHDEIAWVRRNEAPQGKTGYIDKSGKIIIPLLFDDAHNFHNGFAIVFFANSHYIKSNHSTGYYGFVDKAGKYSVDSTGKLEDAYLETYKNNKYSDEYIFIDGKGNLLPNLNISLGYIQWCAKEKNGMFGFIDKSESFMIQPKFDFATGCFSEGLAIFGIYEQ
ncbi:MAG: WG repeat-containing protein [Gammaproteobacteria bacterium]